MQRAGVNLEGRKDRAVGFTVSAARVLRFEDCLLCDVDLI